MNVNFLKYTTVVAILLLSSCAPTFVSDVKMVSGTVKFDAKESDIFTKSSLIEYLKSTKEPSIVLRVPKSGNNVLDENVYNDSKIYGTIEKELSKANFRVRDRGLFNKLTEDNKVTDYSKLKELTNTDLILEVVERSNVKYNTNKYIDLKGKDKTAPFNILVYGQKIEFRLIRVKDNDIVGNYIFYYTPCMNGCTQTYSENGMTYPINYKDKRTQMEKMQDRMLPKTAPSPYDLIIDKTELENFFEISIKRLIRELKQ